MQLPRVLRSSRFFLDEKRPQDFFCFSTVAVMRASRGSAAFVNSLPLARAAEPCNVPIETPRNSKGSWKSTAASLLKNPSRQRPPRQQRRPDQHAVIFVGLLVLAPDPSKDAHRDVIGVIIGVRERSERIKLLVII